MSDYMKEAERLLDQYDNACLSIIDMTEWQARAALLAHIQRGAGVEVCESVTCEQCGHENWIMYGKAPAQITATDMLAAAPAPDQFRDAAKMAPVHCTPTEHDGRIVYEHTSEPIPNADGFVLYAAPAPDRFRAAAKMMAVQPACMTCSGHGMVGGLLPNGGGYQADPCPDCAAPVTAGVPMPECYVTSGGRDLFSEEQMSTYGAICRAAGYARGLAEAGRDAVPLVRNGEVLVAVTGLTGSGKSAIAGEIEIMCRALGLEVEWGEGAAEKHLTHADWTNALEMYRPRVRIVEANIPRTDAALAKWKESK